MVRKLLIIVLSLMFFGFVGKSLQQDLWLAPIEAKNINNPTKNIDRGISAKRGKRIFKTRCMICHGATGIGNGAGGKALSPKPQNLTLPMVQKQTDGEIFWKVSTGEMQ